MAIHSVESVMQGLEWSPIPHLLIEYPTVIGATQLALKLLKCASAEEVVGRSIHHWIPEYNPTVLSEAVIGVQTCLGVVFSMNLSQRGIELGHRNCIVLALNRQEESRQIQEDLHLLRHVFAAPFSLLHTKSESDLEKQVAVNLHHGLDKFSIFKKSQCDLLQITERQVDVKKILHGVIEEFISTHGKDWQVEALIAEETMSIRVDEEVMQFVLRELLLNVACHNEHGKLVIRLLRHEGRVEIQVEHDGVAISPRIAQEVLSKEVHRGFNGGVGLSLCAHWVQKWHGELSIDGLQVKLWLPTCLDVSNRKRSRFSRDYRVLVVDDNLFCQKAMSVCLEKLKLSYQVVGSGEEAVALIKENPTAFDLIFMDLMMTGMGGEEASKEIFSSRGKEAGRLVIIPCTADEGEGKLCAEAGMTGMVSKPINVKKIKQAIREAFQEE